MGNGEWGHILFYSLIPRSVGPGFRGTVPCARWRSKVYRDFWKSLPWVSRLLLPSLFYIYLFFVIHLLLFYVHWIGVLLACNLYEGVKCPGTRVRQLLATMLVPEIEPGFF